MQTPIPIPKLRLLTVGHRKKGSILIAGGVKRLCSVLSCLNAIERGQSLLRIYSTRQAVISHDSHSAKGAGASKKYFTGIDSQGSSPLEWIHLQIRKKYHTNVGSHKHSTKDTRAAGYPRAKECLSYSVIC